MPHSSPRLQLLLRERFFPHDSKMRFQISPHRQGDHPIRHNRVDLDEQFKHVDDIFDRVFVPASDAEDPEAAEPVASLRASRVLT